MNAREATLDDLSIIMEMISKGREHIREFNIKQWANGYPGEDIIINDINLKNAYVLLDGEEIVGYYVMLKHDECYDKIEGKWLDDSPYVAIHRSVTKYFNKGLGSIMFDEIKKEHKHIRVDTHEGNMSMIHCLLKNKFKYCGVIYLKNGDPRNAYEYTEKQN